jgi:hypothetical protein
MRSTRLIGIAASAVVAIGMSSGAQANRAPRPDDRRLGRLALTTAISLYNALALVLNAWPAVVVEFVLVMGNSCLG